MHYGAVPTPTAAIQKIIDARKAGQTAVIPMIVQTETGDRVQIDDPAQQRAYILKTATKAPSKAISELVAEAKAGAAPGATEGVAINPDGSITTAAPGVNPGAMKSKLPTGVIVAGLAAAALFLTMK